METPKHIQRILEYDRIFRAHILYEAIDLESLLDRVITCHFCPNQERHGLFLSLIFREGEIGFGKKIRILRRLLKDSYPDLHVAFGFLTKRLDRLRDLRNRFAHGQVILPDDPPPPEKAEGVSIRWLGPDGMSTEVFIERAIVDRQIKEAKYLMVAVACLAKIIEGRSTGKVDVNEEKGFIDLAGTMRHSIEQDTSPA